MEKEGKKRKRKTSKKKTPFLNQQVKSPGVESHGNTDKDEFANVRDTEDNNVESHQLEITETTCFTVLLMVVSILGSKKMKSCQGKDSLTALKGIQDNEVNANPTTDVEVELTYNEGECGPEDTSTDSDKYGLKYFSETKIQRSHSAVDDDYLSVSDDENEEEDDSEDKEDGDSGDDQSNGSIAGELEAGLAVDSSLVKQSYKETPEDNSHQQETDVDVSEPEDSPSTDHQLSDEHQMLAERTQHQNQPENDTGEDSSKTLKQSCELEVPAEYSYNEDESEVIDVEVSENEDTVTSKCESDCNEDAEDGSSKSTRNKCSSDHLSDIPQYEPHQPKCDDYTSDISVNQNCSHQHASPSQPHAEHQPHYNIKECNLPEDKSDTGMSCNDQLSAVVTRQCPSSSVSSSWPISYDLAAAVIEIGNVTNKRVSARIKRSRKLILSNSIRRIHNRVKYRKNRIGIVLHRQWRASRAVQRMKVLEAELSGHNSVAAMPLASLLQCQYVVHSIQELDFEDADFYSQFSPQQSVAEQCVYQVAVAETTFKFIDRKSTPESQSLVLIPNQGLHHFSQHFHLSDSEEDDFHQKSHSLEQTYLSQHDNSDIAYHQQAACDESKSVMLANRIHHCQFEVQGTVCLYRPPDSGNSSANTFHFPRSVQLSESQSGEDLDCTSYDVISEKDNMLGTSEPLVTNSPPLQYFNTLLGQSN